MSRTAQRVVLGGALVAALLSASALVLRAAAPELTVTYYYLDYCGACSALRKSLAQLPARYANRVAVTTMLHLEPEAQAAIRYYGFDSHGLVIHAGQRLVFRAADHRVRIEDVRETIERELRTADASNASAWFAPCLALLRAGPPTWLPTQLLSSTP